MCEHNWNCETYPVNFLANATCKHCGDQRLMVAVFPIGRAEALSASVNNLPSPAARRWTRKRINLILAGKGKEIIEGTRKAHVDKIHGIFERR